MRIAIVNDLALAREVLRRLVESVATYTVAWTAVDGAEAVRRAAADRPDAILMDLVMPVLDGAETTRQIMATAPCPILIVTASFRSWTKPGQPRGAGKVTSRKPSPRRQLFGAALVTVHPPVAKLAQLRGWPVANVKGWSRNVQDVASAMLASPCWKSGWRTWKAA